MKTKKQLRRAAILQEQVKRALRRPPISLRYCLLSHLACVSGHRKLYMSGRQALDKVYCLQTLAWAKECNHCLSLP